jgi:biotin-dependent carboxylase-like uncharacterized protein
MTAILIERAGPLVTIQDSGRFGALSCGISASGPMDRRAFEAAAAGLEPTGGSGIEFTRAGLAFSVQGAALTAGLAGGAFQLAVNGEPRPWPAQLALAAGDRADVTPGPAGNYGYVRFSAEIDVPPILGSRATNIVAGLGGFSGRALKPGDWLPLKPTGARAGPRALPEPREGAIRFTWGLHANRFEAALRLHFEAATFEVSNRLDRMGVRLSDPAGVFAGQHVLSLVSDAIVPGDIQILGDGTPIVLMRDHQPTGGYPRIATVISTDLDRFAQLRPGTTVRFEPVTPRRARALLLELA